MRKYAFSLIFFIFSLILIFLIKADSQLCQPQSAKIVGYEGDVSRLILEGVTNDKNGGFFLRLDYEGTNWEASSNYPVTSNWRMTGAAADFNDDGYVDLVQGGRGCDSNSDPNDTNLAIFVSRGKDPGNPLRFNFEGPYYIDYTSYLRTYQFIALGAGDYDGDGDADIAGVSWSGRLWFFKNLFVENKLNSGDIPDFDPQPTLWGDLINDAYGEWGAGADRWRWESNICSVDIDNDNDLDLVIGIPSRWASTAYGLVVILINNGWGGFTWLGQRINPYPNTDAYRYGVCGVAAADFDRDGDADFYAGSANSREIYYYRNDGGIFNQINGKTIRIPNNHGSCTFLREGNVDKKNGPDLVLATDGWTANPPGGYVYWFQNDGTGNMTIRPIPESGAQVSPSGDLDSGAIGDFDGDGDLDFFVADGNDSRNVYFFMNEVYPIYLPEGNVYSKNLVPCDFIISDDAIVSAKISVIENKPAKTNIVYYLSNSNDANGNPKWEGPVTPGVEYEFESPGNFLRWKAVFTTTDNRVTPKLYRLEIEYKYIVKREYSRTSHAFTKINIDQDSQIEDVLYSASFEFPKWKGHLRAWDVTDLKIQRQRYSQLAEITDIGAKLHQDAGVNLQGASWSGRRVYTAYDANSDGKVNERLDFDPGNADTLDDFLLLGLGSPEVVPLIRFVLGDGRDWKLGDINHSSPQVLEPPSGDPEIMGSGYASFKESYKNRQRVVFVGANDGMLHCFDAATLDELWAFIPHNLLYKLKRMRIKDPDCGYYLNHEFFVDGTPAIQDVYFGGAWHTVLVCGQGPGWGKDQKCYYFALDVTDPLNPKPLWEFTDYYMGETWSVPKIARIKSPDKWVVFFGSGYDNDYDPKEAIGHYFYVVDVATGELLKSFKIGKDRETSSYGIQNTLPGSPETVDKNNDGYADAVYFGDLLGRMWKIDLTSDIASWQVEKIYEDPYNYPIFTKPAVTFNPVDETVRLYFGTGGDDKAPNNAIYSFVALAETNQGTLIEWYLGSEEFAKKHNISVDKKKGDLAPGEKVWADPVIIDRIVYIATLEGSIESINPCKSTAGVGKIYARYTLGSQMGGSALMSDQGSAVEYLQTLQKVRSAVTVGGMAEVGGQGSQPPMTFREVFIQSFTQPTPGSEPPWPPSQVLAQPVVRNVLVIKEWREVYKVIRIK